MGAESAATFDLANVALVIGGVPINGAGEGGFVEITKKSENVQSSEGVDGSVAVAFTNSRLYEVKIVLLQTSKANAYLSALAQAKLKPKILLVDAGGLDLFTAPTFVISKLPVGKFSNKVQDREWMGLAADGQLFLGGTL